MRSTAHREVLRNYVQEKYYSENAGRNLQRQAQKCGDVEYSATDAI
jgi:hypothetical protein